MKSQRVNLMFRAFSDPTRLRILGLLQAGECCVGDMVTVLKLAQPKISRHLAYLKRTGLIAGRKQGLWRYYRLAEAKGKFHQNLLRCLESCFTEMPALKADADRLVRLRLEGGCCPDDSC